MGKIGVMLRESSSTKHLLRSRLYLQWEGGITVMIEPLQAVIAEYPSVFESAMLVGDVVRNIICVYNAFLCAHPMLTMKSLLKTLYDCFSKMQ